MGFGSLANRIQGASPRLRRHAELGRTRESVPRGGGLRGGERDAGLASETTAARLGRNRDRQRRLRRHGRRRRERDERRAAGSGLVIRRRDGRASSRASRAHRRSLFDAHARNGQYRSIARASVTTHTPPVVPSILIDVSPRLVRSDPSIHRSIHPSIDRRPPSARASRVRSSRAYSRTYRAKGSGVRGRREHRGRRRRRVSRAHEDAPVTMHPPARPERVSPPSRSRFTNHDSSMRPHTHDARSFDRDRETTTVRGLERV